MHHILLFIYNYYIFFYKNLKVYLEVKRRGVSNFVVKQQIGQRLLKNHRAMAVQIDRPAKPGYYKIELHKTVWEVPIRYQELSPIGTGAYGTVW